MPIPPPTSWGSDLEHPDPFADAPPDPFPEADAPHSPSRSRSPVRVGLDARMASSSSFNGQQPAVEPRPRHHLLPSGGYVVPRQCNLAQHVGASPLYEAHTPADLHGPSKKKGLAKLLVQLKEDPQGFWEPAYDTRVVIPATFFWYSPDTGALLEASPRPRHDSKRSHYIPAVSTSGTRLFLSVHDVLGWSFKCPPQQWSSAFSGIYDIDHMNRNHQDNSLRNLQVWRAAGAGGHRAASARLGGRGNTAIP